MYCQKCGYKIKDENAKFCPVCGEEIKESVEITDDFDVATLVKQAQEGDEFAFSELYEHYYPAMLRVACKHTQVSGRNNQQDAEDVLQEAMLSAYKNIKSLKNPKSFKSWLTTIVVNRANDVMTSSYKANNINMSALSSDDKDGKEMEYDPSDESGTYQPDVLLDNQTREDILNDVMSHLSEEQRMVTIMYFYDDMTMDEIAEKLGIKTSTVIGRLQTAKKNIKQEVDSIQKKQDIKLYNISAIPFFMWLLGKAQTETEKEATKTVAQTVANVAGNHTIATSASKVVAGSAAADTSTASALATSASTTATASTVATGVASAATTTGALVGTASVATKIAVGTAVAVAVAGGGYVGVKHIVSNNPSNTSNGSHIYEGVSVSVPDGWVVKDKEVSTNWYSSMPVIALYEGSVDDSNPHILIWADERSTSDVEVSMKNTKILTSITTDTFEFDGIYAESSAQTFYAPEDINEKYYTYYSVKSKHNKLGEIVVNYIDHGQGSEDDEDLLEVIESIQFDTIGSLTIRDASSCALCYGKNTSGSWTDTQKEYYVFEEKELNGKTWYKVGMYTWLIDTTGNAVSFDQESATNEMDDNQQSFTYKGVSVDVPEGWNAISVSSMDDLAASDGVEYNEFMSDAIFLFKGEVDFSNPFVVISTIETSGLGGDFGGLNLVDYGENTIGDNVYSVDCARKGTDHPYSALNITDEDTYNLLVERCGNFVWEYDDIEKNEYTNFYVMFCGRDKGNLEDEDVQGILKSLKFNTLGTFTYDNPYTSSTDEYAAKNSPRLNAKDKFIFLTGQGEYDIFEIVEADGHTWYRAGFNTWLKDDYGSYTSFS